MHFHPVPRAIDDEELRNVIRIEGSSDGAEQMTVLWTQEDGIAAPKASEECLDLSAEQSENARDSTEAAGPKRTTTNRLRQHRHSSR